VDADVYVNVQGDEPLTRPEHIATLLQVMKDPAVQVGTVKTLCAPHEINNPGAVKVVTERGGRALYFSRATIPFDRDGTQPQFFKHPLSKKASGWNSCAFLRMELLSTWVKRLTTR